MDTSSVNSLKFDCLVQAGTIQLRNSIPLERLTNVVPGQMSPGQMFHGQMLHGQMLYGQILRGQMLHGYMLHTSLGHLSTVQERSMNMKSLYITFPRWGFEINANSVQLD